MGEPASSPAAAHPASRVVVVASGVIAGSPIARDPNHFLHLTSPLVDCEGRHVGTFVNDVKCRKWTDLSGNEANMCLLSPDPLDQPPKGSLSVRGDVTLKFRPPAAGTGAPPLPPNMPFECLDFQLDGVQTHSTENGFTVFLFTGAGKGKTVHDAIDRDVTGVGKVLEELAGPNVAPTAKSWRFVFTIC